MPDSKNKKPTLYLVNTNINTASVYSSTTFAFSIINKEEYNAFLMEIKKKHKDFNNFYITPIRYNEVVIPLNSKCYIHLGAARDLVKIVEENCFRERKLKDETIAIDTIIEFSPTELYPKAMKELEQKYDIKRIVITKL